MNGIVGVMDHGIEVFKADERVLVSLELVANHGRGIRVFSDRILFGTYPYDVHTYLVVGWDAETKELICEREAAS